MKKKILAFLFALSIVTTGYAFSDNTAIVTMAAENTEIGSANEQISDVNDSLQDNITDDTHEHEYIKTVIREPDCVNDGEIRYDCECGDIYTEYPKALGHKSSDWIVDLQPTYEKNGKRHKECTVCGEILVSEDIPALIKSIADCDINYTSKFTYTGKAINPAISIKNNGVVLKKGTDYKVEYSNNTNVGTGKIKITGIGKYNGVVNKTFEISAPTVAKVTNFKNTSSSLTGARVGWKKAADVDGYKIEKWNSSKKIWESLATVSANTETYVQRNLPKGTTLKYRIRSYKKVSDKTFYSGWTESYASTKPDNVKNIKATSLTQTSYTISWSPVKNADKYVVYRYDRKTEKYVKLSTVTGTSIKIIGRQPGERNAYKIQAVKVRDWKTYEGDLTKIKFSSKPAQVKNIKATVNRKSITISWNKVSNATGYQIYYNSKTTGNSVLLKEINSGNITSYTTKGLPTGKSYNIKVRAVSKTPDVKVTGQCSNWVKKRVFNDKSDNSILNSYTNSNSLKVVNGQGYSISSYNKNRLENALRSQGGSAAFLLFDIDSGAMVAYNANSYFNTASTVKMPYMLYALKQMESGSPTLDTKLTFTQADKHGGAGKIQYYPIGTQFTIRQVFQHIFDYSDNSAYFMLQRRFGYDGYNKFISSLGCKTSVSAYQRWGYISATDSTKEWLEMRRYLQTGKYRTFMKNGLSNMCAGYFRDGLNNKYTVYSKSGWTTDVQHDTALIDAPHPYVLICLTNRTNTSRMQQVARIADSIHDEMWSYYDK